MPQTIAVAGATGNLGGRIVKALKARGAEVRALVRPETAAERRAPVEALGATVVEVDFANPPALAEALRGADCVVSALQGLREVIVGSQSQLLEAAVTAGVARFIPSDYAADIFGQDEGENRNFDLRREFHRVLDKAAIRRTSVLNGGFMELLTWGGPLVDFRKKSVSYFGSPDQPLDYTTMDDTAAFTAAAALDPEAPPVLRVAGDVVTARDLVAISAAVFGEPFALIRSGSIADLKAIIIREREADDGSSGTFPNWQRLQYTYSMQSGRAHLWTLDNARYPEVQVTKVRELLAKTFGKPGSPGAKRD